MSKLSFVNYIFIKMYISKAKSYKIFRKDKRCCINII